MAAVALRSIELPQMKPSTVEKLALCAALLKSALLAFQCTTNAVQGGNEVLSSSHATRVEIPCCGFDNIPLLTFPNSDFKKTSLGTTATDEQHHKRLNEVLQVNCKAMRQALVLPNDCVHRRVKNSLLR